MPYAVSLAVKSPFSTIFSSSPYLISLTLLTAAPEFFFFMVKVFLPLWASTVVENLFGPSIKAERVPTNLLFQ